MEFYNNNKDYLINGILPLLELKKLKDIPIEMKFSFLYNSSNNINDNNNSINKKPRRSSSNNTLSSSTITTTSNVDSILSNPSTINVNSSNLSNDDEINTVCLPFHNITKNVTSLDFSKNDPLNPINPISLATSIASQSSLATTNPNITVNSLRKSNKRKYADQFLYCNSSSNNNPITTSAINSNNILNQQINSNQSKISQVVKVPGARSQNMYNTNPASLFNVQITKRMRGNGVDDYEYDYSIPTTTSATVTSTLNNNTNPTSQLMQTSTNPPSYVYTTPTQKFMYPTPINGMIGSTIPTMSLRTPNQVYFPYNYVTYQYPYYQPDIFSIMDPNYGNYPPPQYSPNQANLQQQQPPPP